MTHCLSVMYGVLLLAAVLPLRAADAPVGNPTESPAKPVDSSAKSPESMPAAPVVFRLWQGAAPGASGEKEFDIPTITLYRATTDKATGAAFVVCPGGGYGGLAGHEGEPVAKWLNSLGITSVVLKYRLGSHGYRHPIELGDVQRAIRTVRSHAADWNIDAKRIGVLGFSAGGHLASSAVTHFDDGNSSAADPVDKLSCRPDLGILIYPVITMTDPFTHRGSRANLLGKDPDPALIDLMSNEKQVTIQTPPCFLVHGMDDSAVPVQNSIDFALACHKHNVPVELHLFEHGPHGFGLGNDAATRTWPADAALWLERHGFAKQASH